MQDVGITECPMPEPFRAKLGLSVFLAWLYFLGFVSRMIFAPLMPAIEADFGIDHSQAGGLFLMLSVGSLLAPLLAGLISSRVNHRGTIKISAWGIGAVLIPCAFVDSLWVFRVLLVAVGFIVGIGLPSALATITAEIRQDDWGKALSVHQSAPSFSFVLAPLIVAILLNWYPWRVVLIIWGLLALVSALFYTYRGQGGDFPGQPINPANAKALVTEPAFWIMVVLMAVAMGGNAGIFSMLPLFLVNEHGLELSTANTLIGLSQVSGMIMIFVAGWLTDKIGPKRVMTLALALAGISTVLLGQTSGKLMLTLLFIQPMVLASFFPAAYGILSRITPPRMRSVTNALGPGIAFLLGGGLLPLLIGYLGETQTFALGITLAGAFMVAGLPLILALKPGQYDDLPGC